MEDVQDDIEYFNWYEPFTNRFVPKVFNKTHDIFWDNFKAMQHWSDNAKLGIRFATLIPRSMIVITAFLIYLAILVIEVVLTMTTLLKYN